MEILETLYVYDVTTAFIFTAKQDSIHFQEAPDIRLSPNVGENLPLDSVLTDLHCCTPAPNQAGAVDFHQTFWVFGLYVSHSSHSALLNDFDSVGLCFYINILSGSINEL